eukprot:TRINITY_DN25477_c0_g1_i1.p1 TRINITY_DN25477_c0_g1~~TRINITY_DN25477_c0_g1_i1.p1  ORF type:complete len:568 (+),score=178.56 TRINITY_DN25477_c0_g1_i1:89-1792(+)
MLQRAPTVGRRTLANRKVEYRKLEAAEAAAAVPLDEELEPLTVFPGRRRAIEADINSILELFDRELLGGMGEGFCAGQQKAQTPPPQQLRSGAFAVFRGLFRALRFSMLNETISSELHRDLFELICGCCWRSLLAAESLARRVGVVFLVYLLFHSQHPHQYVVPVDVIVLEALGLLRKECLEKLVFLECPVLLQKLAQSGVLSVGTSADWRNLHFDRLGRLAGRHAGIPVGANESAVEATTELVPLANVPVPPSPPPSVQRLRLDAGASAPGRGGRRATPGAQGVVLATQSGEEILNVEDALREARAYGSDLAKLPLSRAAAEGGGSEAATSLAHIAAAAQRFARGTPPAPRELAVASSSSQAALLDGSEAAAAAAASCSQQAASSAAGVLVPATSALSFATATGDDRHGDPEVEIPAKRRRSTRYSSPRRPAATDSADDGAVGRRERAVGFARALERQIARAARQQAPLASADAGPWAEGEGEGLDAGPRLALSASSSSVSAPVAAASAVTAPADAPEDAAEELEEEEEEVRDDLEESDADVDMDVEEDDDFYEDEEEEADLEEFR